MPGPSGRPPVKVLFVAGWGRSGTTILDNLVGAHDGAFTGGEVYWLWRFGFVEGRKCGCGSPFAECELWRAILAAAFGDAVPDPAEVIALQREAIGVRHTPRLLAGARAGRLSPAAARYAEILSRIYTGIAEVTGARVVVDASKRPPDAVITGQAPGIEPYLLHVVRDPRAVAFSWQRTKDWTETNRPEIMTRHGVLMNGAHWVSWNVGAEAARLAYPRGRYRRIRYEDFMTHPRATIDEVFALLGEPRPDGPFLDDSTVVLPTNHTVAGNPTRFRTGRVQLSRDDEWLTAQHPLVRRATTAISLPLLGHYRYPVVVPLGRSRAAAPRS